MFLSSQNVYPVLMVVFIISDVSQIRAIQIKKICYVWCDSQGKFQKLVGLDRGLTTAQLHTLKGYSVQEQFIRYIIFYILTKFDFSGQNVLFYFDRLLNFRKCIYGENKINVPTQNILTLIWLEVLNPLYVFQAFSLIVWFSEGYVYYLGAIVIMSVFGITSSVIQTRAVISYCRIIINYYYFLYCDFCPKQNSFN